MSASLESDRPKGLIVFCETKLRYEKGGKAWIFLGPYLLGAVGLEMVLHLGQPNSGPWAMPGFLAYLVVFPSVWQRILKFGKRRKATEADSLSTEPSQEIA